jgi:HK97 family phage major capsid protein
MASKLHLRSASPTPTATPEPNANPSPTPAANADPVRVRNNPATPATPNATPPGPPRSVREVTDERGRLLAEAEGLQARSRSGEQLNPDDEAHLDQLLDRIEACNRELPISQREERLAQERAASATPARPAPQFTPSQRAARPAANGDDSFADAMRTWFRSLSDEPDPRPDASYRAAQHGFRTGATSVRIPCDFGGTLNRKKRAMQKRTVFSTGGAGSGADYIPHTYSQKVTEYLTYFSPLVGLVDSEVTADGNKRDYFIVDDTALISTYITASGGTEVAPTIPEKNVASGAKTLDVFDITSGYHKLTRQVLRDSAITLVDKVTKAIGNSHARLIEKDMILGTGDGETAIEGLIEVATPFGSPVDDFDADLFEAVYFAVPQQYRDGCIWLMSDSSMAQARKRLKGTDGHSLFDWTMEDGARILTLLGAPVYTSSWMPAFDDDETPVLFFNPMFYMLRLVTDQTLDVLRELFHPHIAYAGGMAFGGGWLGPAEAIQAIVCDADVESSSGS